MAETIVQRRVRVADLLERRLTPVLATHVEAAERHAYLAALVDQVMVPDLTVAQPLRVPLTAVAEYLRRRLSAYPTSLPPADRLLFHYRVHDVLINNCLHVPGHAYPPDYLLHPQHDTYIRELGTLPLHELLTHARVMTKLGINYPEAVNHINAIPMSLLADLIS